MVGNSKDQAPHASCGSRFWVRAFREPAKPTCADLCERSLFALVPEDSCVLDWLLRNPVNPIQWPTDPVPTSPRARLSFFAYWRVDPSNHPTTAQSGARDDMGF